MSNEPDRVGSGGPTASPCDAAGTAGARLDGYPVRIATWNILHGGGPRRIPEIALALIAHRPDVLVVTEFRAARGGQLRAVLADHGLRHQATSDSPHGMNGICIASRWPLEARGERDAPGCDPRRFLVAAAPEPGLIVIGVHMPADRDACLRARHWKHFTAVAHTHRSANAVIAGDFNAGRRDIDGPGKFCREGPFLGALATMGYIDAWRALHSHDRAASWISRSGRGFRLDQIWVSQALRGHLSGAWYSHAERVSGHSDHSILLVTLRAAASGEGRAPA